jgi:hypothetical protein
MKKWTQIALAAVAVMWIPVGLIGILTFYPCKYVFNMYRGLPRSTPMIANEIYVSGPYHQKANDVEFCFAFMLGPLMPPLALAQALRSKRPRSFILDDHPL